MHNKLFETLVGAIVLCIAAYFLVIASGSTGKPNTDYYQLTARFDRVDGLRTKGDVRVSGLPVGYVTSQHIDPQTYLAVITLSVDTQVGIPEDSTAEIIGDGLLGDKYIAIIPGGSDRLLKEGEQIAFTQSAVSLESLIGKFMFGGSDDETASTDAAEDDTSIDDIF